MSDPQEVTLTHLIPALRSAQIDVTVHVSSTLNVTAYTARQKVSGLALSKIGTGIGADEPELIMSRERIIWRVPLFLALPSLGRLGNVGAIDVDAQTGEVLADDQLIETFIRNARQLPHPTA
jgi:hypothetical protein